MMWGRSKHGDEDCEHENTEMRDRCRLEPTSNVVDGYVLCWRTVDRVERCLDCQGIVGGDVMTGHVAGEHLRRIPIEEVPIDDLSDYEEVMYL